jgi:hypothetical protein
VHFLIVGAFGFLEQDSRLNGILQPPPEKAIMAPKRESGNRKEIPCCGEQQQTAASEAVLYAPTPTGFCAALIPKDDAVSLSV